MKFKVGDKVRRLKDWRVSSYPYGDREMTVLAISKTNNDIEIDTLIPDYCDRPYGWDMDKFELVTPKKKLLVKDLL